MTSGFELSPDQFEIVRLTNEPAVSDEESAEPLSKHTARLIGRAAGRNYLVVGSDALPVSSQLALTDDERIELRFQLKRSVERYRESLSVSDSNSAEAGPTAP